MRILSWSTHGLPSLLARIIAVAANTALPLDLKAGTLRQIPRQKRDTFPPIGPFFERLGQNYNA